MITGITASQLRRGSVLSVTDALIVQGDPYIDVLDATFELDLQVSIADADMGLPPAAPRTFMNDMSFTFGGVEHIYGLTDYVPDEQGAVVIRGGIHGNRLPEGIIFKLDVKRGDGNVWTDTQSQAGWDEENANLYAPDPYYSTHNFSSGIVGYPFIYYRWRAISAETGDVIGLSDEFSYFQLGLV